MIFDLSQQSDGEPAQEQVWQRPKPTVRLTFEILDLGAGETWAAYHEAWKAYSKAIRADADSICLAGGAADLQRPSVFRILLTAGLLRGPVQRVSRDGKILRIVALALDWLPIASCPAERLEIRADKLFQKMYQSGAIQ